MILRGADVHRVHLHLTETRSLPSRYYAVVLSAACTLGARDYPGPRVNARAATAGGSSPGSRV